MSFRFKQFSIRNDGSAMKVGTDGVLLGAWASLKGDPQSILDIGAGSGLIALMLAQRSRAGCIDAIEVDGRAFEQCVENFEASPWSDRLYCYHCSLREFASEIDTPYDLILTNPPFYPQGVSSGNPARDRARQQTSLPFDLLLEDVSGLLHPEGKFCVVLPQQEEAFFLALAQKVRLHLNRITRVRGNADSPVKRSLMELSFHRSRPVEGLLTIEAGRNEYTAEYRALTRDFYLKL